jgi:outer membrane protein OmpA-like peptidoglycan-associated protein
MKSKAILLGTVAAVSIAAASQSEAHNQGWYIGLEGGANWVTDNDGLFGLNSGPPVFFESISFDTGWAVLATVGYGFDSNWRIELEAGYRENDLDTLTLPAFAFLGPFNGGDVNEITLMANVLYDIPLTERLDLTLGLGAGADRAEFQTPAFWGGNDDDWNFAFQAIAGLSYAVTDRLDITLTYRYLNVSEPDFNVPGGPISAVAEHWQFEDLEKHTVTIGLRYDLYEDAPPPPPPAPPPPPMPAAPEPQQFIIYFGFNKCNITPEADQVLGEAASAAKSDGQASVRIVGHTDTVGSASYNQRLSECRADAAKSNLVGKGVPADAISTSGRGESELLVKTGDNVKEPQNRRATVDID